MTRKAPADNVNLAIVMVCAFGLSVPFMDAAVKFLGASMPPPQITLARFSVQCVLVGIFLGLISPASAVRPDPVWPLIARGVSISIGTAMLYAGFAAMPLVEVVAIYFLQPLILTGLSVVFLKESVGWRRWLAVLVGLTGAMLIIGPNFQRIGTAALYPVLAALFFAGAGLLTRRWASAANLPVFLLVTAATATSLLAGVLLIGWSLDIPAISPRLPSLREFGLLVFIGAGSTVTTMMLTQAFRTAPASVIAPFMYVEVVGAAFVGYLIFSDVPSATTSLGAVLVVGAGLFVWWRENRLSENG